MADFNSHELYEIKPNNSIDIISAENKLQDAENGFKSIGLSSWHMGSLYIPPSILVLPNSDIASVRIHSPRVIVYDIFNTKLTILISVGIAGKIDELIASFIAASSRPSAVFGF